MSSEARHVWAQQSLRELLADHQNGSPASSNVWEILQQVGFEAPRQSRFALQILADTPQANWPPQARDYESVACELAMQQQVAEFARTFFERSLDQRKTTFQRLLVASHDFPALQRWLKHLEAGLLFAPETLQGLDPHQEQWVKQICQVFVTTPQRRLRESSQLIQAVKAQCEALPAMTVSLSRLSNAQPELVKLLPAFFQGVASVHSFGAATSQPVKDAEAAIQLRKQAERFLAAQGKVVSPSVVQEEELSGFGALLGYAFLFGIIIMMGLAFRARNSPDSLSPPRYSYQTGIQEFQDSFNTTATRIRRYGLLEISAPDEAPSLRRYRVLGPGPEEFVLDSNLLLMGIKPEDVLKTESGDNNKVEINGRVYDLSRLTKTEGDESKKAYQRKAILRSILAQGDKQRLVGRLREHGVTRDASSRSADIYRVEGPGPVLHLTEADLQNLGFSLADVLRDYPVDEPPSALLPENGAVSPADDRSMPPSEGKP